MDYKLFVKIFTQERFRDDFINGRLYMNPLSYFVKVEDESENNVADKHEGVSAWLQPQGHALKMSLLGTDIEITEKDLAGPIAMRMNWVDNVNVFCMTYLHSHGMLSKPIPESEVEKLKGLYRLPEKAENLGVYFAVIADVVEFMNRVKSSLDRLADNGDLIGYMCNPVTYFNENDDHHVDETSLQSVFFKRSSYSHQREYRIAVDRNKSDSAPFTLDIGSIKDIVKVGEVKDFNNLINIQLNR